MAWWKETPLSHGTLASYHWKKVSMAKSWKNKACKEDPSCHTYSLLGLF